MTIPKRTLQNKIYSNVLEIVGIAAGVFIVICFILYLLNFFTPFINLNNLPEIWNKNSKVLIKEFNYPIHWDWIKKLNYIDFICLFGLFIFSLSNIISYIFVLPIYIIKKNFKYAIFVVIQLIIFAYAAFGNLFGF